jgi:hypothetical protein
MAKVQPIQTNFSAGELSPRVHSRVDVAKYNNGLKVCENVTILVQGGTRRRPGSRFVAEVKNSTLATRLIEFVFNRDQAYMLEFGQNYMRVFKDGAPVLAAGIPYEVATPYTAAMLPDVAYVQGADTMFLVHPDVPVHRLQRFGDASWRLLPASFAVEPFDELGHAGTAALTLSAATVGTGRTFTSTGQFLASDVGRDIVSGAGLATVTAYVDADTVTVQVKSEFSATSIASSAWTLTVSPQTTLTPSAFDPVGATITATLSANGWRAADVGRFVKVNGGLIRITGITSPTVADAVILQALTSAVAAIPNSWTLNASVWNPSDGYPRAVTLYEQRLQLSGSPGYPQTVWGSRIGDVLNFELGTKDDDAYAYDVSTSVVAPVQHLGNAARLMVFTSSNEMSMRGGVEKPITPLGVQKKDESTSGSNNVRPVKVGNELIFVQRAGQKVRALGYRYDIDGFDSPDRTVFSEHITGAGVVDMCWQQEPDAQLYCVRSDGQMAVSTYNTEQEVIAWGRWITDGVIESVASIPTSTSEQTWAIVRRTVGGVQRRFVEYFDPALATDCAVTATAVTATATWSGLSHLNGKTVQALADGVYQGTFTVTGGAITLPRTANSVEIGLGYTARLQLLNPEVGGPGGTSQGAAISVGEVIVRVLDTVSAVINGQTKTFRKMGSELLDRPPAVGTGDLREITLSDALYRNELTITQPLPVDFHLLAVIRKCTVND